MRRRMGPRPDRLAALREGLASYALVALGSAIGGTLRALVSLAVPAAAGLPWATLVVNVLGSFAIALYATLTGPGGRRPASLRQRHFVTAGLCGGFTTFSLFGVETLRLAQSGRPEAAAAWVAFSVAAWLGAAWLGHLAALRLGAAPRL